MSTVKYLLASTSWSMRSVRVAQFFKSNDAAVLLGYLCDMDKYFSEKDENFNGWFYATMEKIERKTVCSDKVQKKWFDIFEDMDLIDTKLIGLPRKKHFKIIEKTLETLMKPSYAQEAVLATPNERSKIRSEGVPIYSKNRLSKKDKLDNDISNEISGAALASLESTQNRNKINGNNSLVKSKRVKLTKSKSTVPQKYIKVATKLSKVIKVRHNVVTSKTTINTWAKTLQLLHTKDGVDTKRQKAAINWYKEATDTGYVIQSATALRNKIISVESAMTRKDYNAPKDFDPKRPSRTNMKWETTVKSVKRPTNFEKI